MLAEKEQLAQLSAAEISMTTEQTKKGRGAKISSTS